jgi:hypothetical protein
MLAFTVRRFFTDQMPNKALRILQRNDTALIVREIWQNSTQRALCLRQFHFAVALTAACCAAHPLRGQSNGRCRKIALAENKSKEF